MKLKAVEVMQILLVVEAIKQGSLDGSKVADEMISQFVDRYVEGEPEALAAIKEVVKDIDAGFIGGIINKVLKKFAVEKTEEGKSGIGRFNGRCVICESPLDKDDWCPNKDCANNIGNQEVH
jgi:hypothetical protein